MTPSETKVLMILVRELTGNLSPDEHRQGHIASAVDRLVAKFAKGNFKLFLYKMMKQESIWQDFMSAITIHTTFWFRESQHIDQTLQLIAELGLRDVRIWSAACSSGQEVYSLAFALEALTQNGQLDSYELFGSDIDSVSLNVARRGEYKANEAQRIPQSFHKFIRNMDTASFEIDPQIKARCHFFEHNLLSFKVPDQLEPMDFIFCRNVMIYFSQATAARAAETLARSLKPHGRLLLGMSEFLEIPPKSLASITNNHFKLAAPSKISGAASTHTGASTHVQIAPSKVVRDSKILVLEDNRSVSTLLKKLLTKAGFTTFEALNGQAADQVLASHAIDAVTIDLNLPDTTGAEWWERARKRHPHLKAVVVSEVREDDAKRDFNIFDIEISDYFEKDKLLFNQDRLIETLTGLCQTSPSAMSVSAMNPHIAGPVSRFQDFMPECILIGGSTGAIPIIKGILKALPLNSPPVLIVQHINTKFAQSLFESLVEASHLAPGSVRDGDTLKANHLYMMTGDEHLGVARKSSQSLVIQRSKQGAQFGHRPSVHHLFASAAAARVKACAVLLTGMGKDGAEALKALRDAGSLTIAQDQASSAVFGMPGEAVRLKACEFVLAPKAISDLIHQVIDKKHQASA